MGYRHGIYISEIPTSIVPPVKVESAMPVFFVTAPVNLANEPYKVTNEPKLCYTYQEAVEYFGFNLKSKIWNNYTSCEAIYSQFALYAVAPMVIINVLDPKEHKKVVADEAHKVSDFSCTIKVDGILIDTLKIKKVDNGYYEAGKHYTLAFDVDGFVVINIKKGVADGISENASIAVSYEKLAPEMVDIYDIIGGYDNLTGKNKGLELMNEIFPRFRIVPGQIVVPKFSSDPAVAAVMETKASNINGHFKCITINDLPTMIENDESQLELLKYADIPAWKNENNYTSERQYNCYPKLRLGEQLYFYSTQMAGLICKTDSQNDGIPYNSPSNKNLKTNGLSYEDGQEVIMNVEQANYLNGNGIVSAINFTNGWVAWGNRTGAYPGNTDVKDSFISVRRMFDWIANTIVLTYWNKVDYPLTRRTIDTIIDSINIWFNGLAAREFILGGRIELLESENPITDLIDGIVKFHVSIAPPPPMREADFILEYDTDYLQTLFS